MAEGTCAECGTPLPKGRRRYCTKYCQKAAERKRYRAKLVPMDCAHCGCTFMGKRWHDKDRARYCSTECEGLAKAERYGIPCEHGPSGGNTCPVCTFIERTNGRLGWRDVLRADPCAYCGQAPANGIDHIEPKDRHPDRSDTDNLTGACKECNQTKRDVPLLLALPWIPISRRYHEMRRERFAQRAA